MTLKYLLLSLIAVVLVVGLSACNGGSDGSDEDEQASGQELEEFRAFAPEIAAALAAENPAFFLDRADPIQRPCTGTETSGPCTAGTEVPTFEGLGTAVSGREFDFVIPTDEYRSNLEPYIQGAVPAISDSLGPGSLALYGLAAAPSGNMRPQFVPSESVYYAITSGIINRGSDNSREVRAFAFVQREGEWRFLGEVQVPGGGDVQERNAGWLTGSCPDCYEDFEPWTQETP
jgi:hypothetical protein